MVWTADSLQLIQWLGVHLAVYTGCAFWRITKKKGDGNDNIYTFGCANWEIKRNFLNKLRRGEH